MFLVVLINGESNKVFNLKCVLRSIRILNSFDSGHSRVSTSIWGFRDPPNDWRKEEDMLGFWGFEDLKMKCQFFPHLNMSCV